MQLDPVREGAGLGNGGEVEGHDLVEAHRRERFGFRSSPVYRQIMLARQLAESSGFQVDPLEGSLVVRLGNQAGRRRR
jgi:hypothetical protein